MAKKRILHVSHSLDTGGGPLYVSKIIKDIPEIDHYVAGNEGYYYDLLQQSLGNKRLFRLHGKNIFLNIYALHKICEENNITIIHCHGRGASLYCRLLKVFDRRISLLYTVHGFHPDTLNRIFKFFYLFFEKAFFPLTDIIINVSKSEKERFIRMIKPRQTNKIHYIPNYISESDLQHRPLPFSLNKEFVNLLFVGRLSHEKGIDILIDAWKSLRVTDRVRLYVIGYGPYASLFQREDLNGIFYMGKIENASAAIPYFDAIIIPSRFEGMPFIGLEAMILKANVIATPATGTTDLFQDTTAWMATTITPDALKKSICHFLKARMETPETLKEKVNRNYERVKSEFSIQNADKLKQLYELF